MKKLTLALLLFITAPAFAQKNELALSPGAVYYRGYSANHPKSSYIGNLEGGGFRVGMYYLRNIKWLQLGGGLEIGKLAYNKIPTTYYDPTPYTVAERQSIGAPFNSLVVQANLRVQVKPLTFYAGATGGYLVATARRRGETYSLGGFLAGPQAGVSYKILQRLSLSADVGARFVNLEDNTPPFFGGTRNITYYSHMNYCAFSIGARYSF